MKPGLCVLLALCAGALPAEEERFQVRAAQVEGEWRCSLLAERAPLGDVLAALAGQCGVALEGSEELSRTTLVDADLRDRPVRQALDYVLGSVGLRVEPRAGAWLVRASLRAPLAADELRDQALSVYLSALRDFPDHPAGADALVAQADIELARGHASAARLVLDELVERYSDSELVPEALLRAGELLVELQDWQRASDRFGDLLRLDRPHDLEARARVQLARCTVELGDGERALTMIDVLDGMQPPSDASDEQARRLVRARAHVELEDFAAARDALSLAEATPLGAARRLEALELRARTQEGLGLPSEAARAWLALSREAPGPDRTIALRHAARLALEAGDEISVLMIHRLAEESGAAGQTDELALEARERLALDGGGAAGGPAAELLVQAERLLAEGLIGDAARALADLEPIRAQLDPDQTARFALAYGRALASTSGVDAMLTFLREVLPSLEDAEQRRAVYLLAGQQLEESDRIDDAIEAYQGRL